MKLLGRAVLALGLATSGCAVLQHVEISEIDQSAGAGSKFEVKASETGVNLQEGAGIAKAVSSSSHTDKAADTVNTVWQLITFGPKTGNVVLSDTYADDTYARMNGLCAPARLAGVITIRETNKYPVISGEIVRVIGYCREESR